MSELTKFLDLGISKAMVHELQKKGFEEPTPIQEKIIPLLLAAERDLVGKAQTGTGKTAAFGIPIIEKLKENSRHVQVLVLVPTRELAIQVSEEINSFKGKRKLSIMPIYGGQSIEQQLRKLKRGVDVVVGTPGRVQDHLNRKTLDVSKVSYLILDEADEMLNMGFLEDVEKIMAETNPERNTLLFSATMPKEIRNVAKKYMRNYELIEVEGKHVTVDLTDQIYFEVANRDKFEALCRIIDIEDEFYGLVFCRTKIDANNVMSHLQDRGYDAEALHGDISQIQRETILRKFKKRQINILVATDVAARGIDIQNLTHVINYAIPQDAEAYVHRIGRTGRAGREGTAITFITPDEYRKLMYIQKVTRTDIRKEKLPQVRDVIDIKRNRIMSEIDELVQEQPTHDFLQMAEQLLAHNRAEDAMAALLQYLFADELNPESYNEVRDVYPQIKGKTRLFVAKGKKDGMTRRKLVEFIKNKANVDDRKIDDVQVMDIYSFITVPFREAEQILEAFKKENTGKRKLVEVANTKDKSQRRK